MGKLLFVVTLTWTKTPLLILVIVGSGCTPWPPIATRSCTSGVQSASVFEWKDAQSSIARFDFFKLNKLDTSVSLVNVTQINCKCNSFLTVNVIFLNSNCNTSEKP